VFHWNCYATYISKLFWVLGHKLLCNLYIKIVLQTNLKKISIHKLIFTFDCCHRTQIVYFWPDRLGSYLRPAAPSPCHFKNEWILDRSDFVLFYLTVYMVPYYLKNLNIVITYSSYIATCSINKIEYPKAFVLIKHNLN